MGQPGDGVGCILGIEVVRQICNILMREHQTGTPAQPGGEKVTCRRREILRTVSVVMHVPADSRQMGKQPDAAESLAEEWSSRAELTKHFFNLRIKPVRSRGVLVEVVADGVGVDRADDVGEISGGAELFEPVEELLPLL